MTTTNQTTGHDTTPETIALAALRKTILLDDELWAETSPGIAINRILATITEHLGNGTNDTFMDHDGLVAQMKADPEQSARAYRDVWDWWFQAVADRDKARDALAAERERIAAGIKAKADDIAVRSQLPADTKFRIGLAFSSATEIVWSAS